MRKSLAVFTLLTALLSAGAAWAHAHLVSAEPAVGSTVAAADALKLKFNERLEIKFSKAEIAGPDGKPVDAGAVTLDAAGTTLLLSPAAKLGAGTYTVHWHVVSVDTHRTEGTFSFTVKP